MIGDLLVRPALELVEAALVRLEEQESYINPFGFEPRAQRNETASAAFLW